MLPHWRYLQARYDADFHVQVRVLDVESGVKTPGQAGVDAEVIRVFRGEPRMKAGDRVHFAVSVLTGDEDWEHVPIGGTRWTNYAALRSARFLEVFLNGAPPDCEVSLWQIEILHAPTDQPKMAGRPPLPKRTISLFGRVLQRLLRRRLPKGLDQGT